MTIRERNRSPLCPGALECQWQVRHARHTGEQPSPRTMIEQYPTPIPRAWFSQSAGWSQRSRSTASDVQQCYTTLRTTRTSPMSSSTADRGGPRSGNLSVHDESKMVTWARPDLGGGSARRVTAIRSFPNARRTVTRKPGNRWPRWRPNGEADPDLSRVPRLAADRNKRASGGAAVAVPRRRQR